ncbi:hypothetical protein CYMTET_56518 [Cymbomonas tetramitiformis]|uniref:Uncharacterized protein n=1 Tax=Cymbomonas tetramitiformis TaxID=36881 RepID=A0AAE0EM90_9CHLO|nr:hypothetical protein CYMTET_56518 [Cymbomonas tetramitiformis]
MARGGRQFRGDAMDYSRGEVEVEAQASASVRPRGVTEGCYAAAAGVAGRGEGEAAGERPDTGTSLSRQHVHCGDSEFSVVLLKEKGRRHQRVKRRLCIPWKGVALLKELIEHWEFHRDTAWNSSEKTQPDAYWLLPEDPKNFKASVANDWIGLALSELDCRPPEGGHFSAHSTRKGATTCARAVGVTMEKVCFLGGWSQFSSAVQHYIDPTALRDADMDYYFAWGEGGNVGWREGTLGAGGRERWGREEGTWGAGGRECAVIVGGDVIVALAKHIVLEYGIPKNMVSVKDNLAGKGK